MSTCISRHGEYSEHEPADNAVASDVPEFTCRRCWVFDEDAALAEITRLRAALAPPLTQAQPDEAVRAAVERAIGGAVEMKVGWANFSRRVVAVETLRAILDSAALSSPAPADQDAQVPS